jgi:hypothetical protein
MGERRHLSQELVRKLLRRLPRESLHLSGHDGSDSVPEIVASCSSCGRAWRRCVGVDGARSTLYTDSP